MSEGRLAGRARAAIQSLGDGFTPHFGQVSLWIVLAVLGATATGAQTPEPTVTVPEDLLAVLSLRGKPCGQVVNHRRRGDNDYDVTCASGDRYRVFVRDGRVVIEMGE